MPRRIPDYPDIYASWNFICTVGYLITVIGIVIFIFLLIYPLFAAGRDQIFKNIYYVQTSSFHEIVVYRIYKFKNFFNERSLFVYRLGVMLSSVIWGLYWIVDKILFVLTIDLHGFLFLRAEERRAMVFFSPYNFFNTMHDFSTSYMSFDRQLLLFFFVNLQKVWIIDDVMKFLFEDLQKQNVDKLFHLSYRFNFVAFHNYFLLCFIFVFHNWLILFSYVFFFTEKRIIRLIHVSFLNIVINKFMQGLGDNSLTYLSKKLNLITKTLFFIKK